NLHYEQIQDRMINEYENELPFEIPSKWVWCNLGMLFSHNTGKALNASKTDGVSLTYITTSNVYWNSFELDNLKIMPFTDSEIEKCTVKKGDLLVCEGGDIGRAAIWQFENEIRIQNHLHRLRPYDRIYTKFYYYIMYLYKANGRINGNGIGLQGLSSNALHNIIVPVPPVEEQKRIVDNIDSVLSLIEQIESHKQSLSSQIDNIKSKILDLAIHGKLVPQDPNDEPASVLLERIRAEKEELIKQGKIKRDKKESVIFKGDDNSYYEKIGDSVACIDAELPFEIPDSWCWARLSSFTEVIMGSSPRSQDICSDSNYTEFHQGKIYFSDYFLKESNQYTKKISKIAPENSVLLCVRAPVGEVNITDREICIGRGLSSIHAYDKIQNNFLFYWLKTQKRVLVNKSTGSTFSAITIDTVKNILLPIPPINEQLKITQKILDLNSNIESIKASLS
ncbi:restriction endonuclease subunit S, partial [Pseudoruminococcus massiliensis]|uniref:restriction endonuclease subunit S n=1 Tax=Pseudoruminococcus massiliensis TaxID=2086583 RepID=UPI0022E548AB